MLRERYIACAIIMT